MTPTPPTAGQVALRWSQLDRRSRDAVKALFRAGVRGWVAVPVEPWPTHLVYPPVYFVDEHPEAT